MIHGGVWFHLALWHILTSESWMHFLTCYHCTSTPIIFPCLWNIWSIAPWFHEIKLHDPKPCLPISLQGVIVRRSWLPPARTNLEGRYQVVSLVKTWSVPLCIYIDFGSCSVTKPISMGKGYWQCQGWLSARTVKSCIVQLKIHSSVLHMLI